MLVRKTNSALQIIGYMLGVVLLLGAMGLLIMFIKDAAASFLNRYFEIPPSVGEVYFGLGLALFGGLFVGGMALRIIYKRKKAIGKITDFINQRPENSDLFLQRGEAYMRQGKNEDALRDFTEFMKQGGDVAEALARQATAYFRMKEYIRAIELYTKAIEQNPKNSEYYHERGLAYWKQGDTEKAHKDFQKAVELNPEDALSREYTECTDNPKYRTTP